MNELKIRTSTKKKLKNGMNFERENKLLEQLINFNKELCNSNARGTFFSL